MAFSSHSICMSGSGVLGKKLKKLTPLWPFTALTCLDISLIIFKVNFVMGMTIKKF